MEIRLSAENSTVLSGLILIPTIEIDYCNFKHSHKYIGITLAWLKFSVGVHSYFWEKTPEKCCMECGAEMDINNKNALCDDCRIQI